MYRLRSIGRPCSFEEREGPLFSCFAPTDVVTVSPVSGKLGSRPSTQSFPSCTKTTASSLLKAGRSLMSTEKPVGASFHLNRNACLPTIQEALVFVQAEISVNRLPGVGELAALRSEEAFFSWLAGTFIRRYTLFSVSVKLSNTGKSQVYAHFLSCMINDCFLAPSSYKVP